MQLQHLVGGVPAGEAEELGEIPERAGPRGSRPAPGDLGLPRSPHEPDEDLHERRLPGPVRPEQADELAFAHPRSTPLSASTEP